MNTQSSYDEIGYYAYLTPGEALDYWLAGDPVEECRNGKWRKLTPFADRASIRRFTFEHNERTIRFRLPYAFYL